MIKRIIKHITKRMIKHIIKRMIKHVAKHMTMHITTDMRSERTAAIFQVVSVYVDCASTHQSWTEASGPQRINRRLNPYDPNEISG